jgi:hypothetical protein
MYDFFVLLWSGFSYKFLRELLLFCMPITIWTWKLCWSGRVFFWSQFICFKIFKVPILWIISVVNIEISWIKYVLFVDFVDLGTRRGVQNSILRNQCRFDWSLVWIVLIASRIVGLSFLRSELGSGSVIGLNYGCQVASRF